MKIHDMKTSLLKRAAAVLFTAALILSLSLPMAGMDAYAAAGSTSSAVTSDTGTETSSDADKPAAVDTAELQSAETSINVYKTKFNRHRDSKLEIEADITSADGREVHLQRYDSDNKSWKTILKATAEAGEDDSTVSHVSFTVPSKERAKTTSLWRIYVPKTETAPEAASEEITVITRNLDDLDMSARAACIYRIDSKGQGTMIYSSNSFKEYAQASTTKLMTAVLLLEKGSLSSSTRISQHAASTPYASGRLAAGDVYSNRDLLYAMLLPSSNDAATAVAESVGGSEAGFVSMMNNKAKELGFTHTQFRNPHGLDAEGHYTTAYELAKLTAYAYTFPEIRECWATQCKTIKSLERGRSWTLWSTNAIFSYVKNFLGGKTGTESNAGCCFTGVYTCNGGTYVTVVLGSGYGFSRWSDTKKLHSYIEDYAGTRY